MNYILKISLLALLTSCSGSFHSCYDLEIEWQASDIQDIDGDKNITV